MSKEALQSELQRHARLFERVTKKNQDLSTSRIRGLSVKELKSFLKYYRSKQAQADLAFARSHPHFVRKSPGSRWTRAKPKSKKRRYQRKSTSSRRRRRSRH